MSLNYSYERTLIEVTDEMFTASNAQWGYYFPLPPVSATADDSDHV